MIDGFLIIWILMYKNCFFLFCLEEEKNVYFELFFVCVRCSSLSWWERTLVSSVLKCFLFGQIKMFSLCNYNQLKVPFELSNCIIVLNSA